MADTPDDLPPLDALQAEYRGVLAAREALADGTAEYSPAEVLEMLGYAFRALAEKDATIARLTAELDDCRNVPVEYVTERGLEAAMAADPNREDGAVIRCTDGQKRAFAWKAATREWEQTG